MEKFPTEEKKCFEDFTEGFNRGYEIPGLSTTEIIEFATLYDPQRFHLDAQEAAGTHFGSLVASGFQTQLLCFKPFCLDVLNRSWAIGAPGIDSIKWLRPWYPGEALSIKVTLIDRRPSAKRHDRGYLRFKLGAAVDSLPTFSMEWVVIILTREGIKPPASQL
ncbi:MAG: acyl dehydratase [Deltaproteobacteria bacterium]|nr:acyl dehydratase [Deltaproteobacteria bacterium]